MTYHPDVLNSVTNYPVPHHLLPSQLLNNTRSTSNLSSSSNTLVQERGAEDLTPYAMPDLTIPSYLRLARRLGKASNRKKKLWKRFTTYMYMSL